VIYRHNSYVVLSRSPLAAWLHSLQMYIIERVIWRQKDLPVPESVSVNQLGYPRSYTGMPIPVIKSWDPYPRPRNPSRIQNPAKIIYIQKDQSRM